MEFVLKHQGVPVKPTPSQIVINYNKVLSVGRKDTDVVLRGKDHSVSMMVSRKHAMLRWDPKQQGVVLIDNGSVNGLYVNGSRITRPMVLRDGDLVWFSSKDFAYKFHCERTHRNEGNSLKSSEMVSKVEDPSTSNRPKKNTLVETPTGDGDITVVSDSVCARGECILLREKLNVGNIAYKSARQEVQAKQEQIEELKSKLGSFEAREQEFITKLRDFLECPICFLVSTSKNRVLLCGHNICADCLEEYTKLKNTCPTCNSKITSKKGVQTFVLDQLAQFIQSIDSEPRDSAVKSTEPTFNAEMVSETKELPERKRARGMQQVSASACKVVDLT